MAVIMSLPLQQNHPMDELLTFIQPNTMNPPAGSGYWVNPNIIPCILFFVYCEFRLFRLLLTNTLTIEEYKYDQYQPDRSKSSGKT